MKRAIAAIPLTGTDITGEIPEPGIVRGVAFVPSDKRVQLPGRPPDMSVVWVEVDPTAEKRTRRFFMTPNGMQVDEADHERAEYCGSAVSPVTGVIVHVFEIIDRHEEAARMMLTPRVWVKPDEITKRHIEAPSLMSPLQRPKLDDEAT